MIIFENHYQMMEEFRAVATELGYELLYSQDELKINPSWPSRDGSIICLFDFPISLPHVYTSEGLLMFGSNSFSKLEETFLEWLQRHFETEEIRPHKTPAYGTMEYHEFGWGPEIRIIGRK